MGNARGRQEMGGRKRKQVLEREVGRTGRQYRKEYWKTIIFVFKHILGGEGGGGGDRREGRSGGGGRGREEFD